MIQGLYSAASSLTAATQQQDVISHNIAHASIPGYRARGLTFATFEPTSDEGTDPSAAQAQGTQVSQEYTLFRPGDYQQTDNPLEVAVRGDGFFVLQTTTGPVYTRNGSFELNGSGQLQTKSGVVVDGATGPINIPPGTARIAIGSDGSVSADGTPVGQLRVVTFGDSTRLLRVGPTLFEAPDDAPPLPAQAQIAQGYRELSNVSVVQEMVNLIVGSRHYEAASKALRALSDTLQQRTQAQQG